MKGLPALDKLVRGVKLAARRGFLWGLDKRKLRIRSEHSALNTLFQSAGAVVMKVAMVLLDDAVREAGLDAKKVGDFHDEGIFEVLPEHAEQLAELARAAVIKAGVLLKLNLPLEADAKIGDNWAQIH
jgi:DNA polymerase I-like protein with 3'-5' exonuclease and polymerase domains